MNVDIHTVNVLSLCTGGGGLELGLKLACEAFRTVCYVEHEAYCCEVLAARMEEKALDDAPVWTDLRTFDGKPWRGIVDCIIGGYPCQPFSCAGKHTGEADERHLWPDIARIIGETEPWLCFFENVSGHLNLGFDTVLSDLREMGYRVAAGLFTAAEVSASHRRERLFIMANTSNWKHSPKRWEGNQLSRTSRELADTEGVGSQELGQERQGKVQPDRSDNELADTEGVGMEGKRTGGQQVSQAQTGQEISGCDSLPVFPPAPSDLEGWREVLEIDPTLEPAICRVADGMASRVERLRMLGNGVVPLQAAYAFVSLWACLWNDRPLFAGKEQST